MKKLFGRDKPKVAKGSAGLRESQLEEQPEQLQSVQDNHRGPSRRRSSSEERWEVVSSYDNDVQLTRPPPLSDSRSSSVASLPPGSSLPVSTPLAPRPGSPFSVISPSQARNKSPNRIEREAQLLRKKPPGGAAGAAALGILKALDPHSDLHSTPAQYDDMSNNSEGVAREEKKEKKGFWERAGGRDKEKEKDRERGRDREKKDDDSHAELTRMIGWLTATASEDWSFVLEVCERASASETNAKEAAKALRREFKYAEPSAQLSAARLWAIMLRNSSDVFISQCTTRKFLDTLEDVLTSPRTSPVVRERLLDILAAAAYITSAKSDGKERPDKDGFRGLWRKVKPVDKPDEGFPFDEDDAMFNPPAPRRLSQYSLSIVGLPDEIGLALPMEPQTIAPTSRKHKSSVTRNRVIPPDEDMRRLLQECKVGRGNAALLSENLAFASPEDLQDKEIIREFYYKCRASQELIFAQIPWASAGAERSRLASGRGLETENLHDGLNTFGTETVSMDDTPTILTAEEQLLAALLDANEELLEALRLYDDLERVGVERQAEERSRKEVRMDRSQLQFTDDGGLVHLELPSQMAAGSSSHTPSPSSSPSPSAMHPVSTQRHPFPSIPHLPLSDDNSMLSSHSASQVAILQSLAPPRPAPHGPRSFTQHSARSRTPSWERESITYSGHRSRTSSVGSGRNLPGIHQPEDGRGLVDEVSTPLKPSAKAMGKRRINQCEDSDRSFDPDDIFLEHRDENMRPDDGIDSDPDDADRKHWYHHVHYVYDAAAERTEKRLREGHLALVNGLR